MKIKYWLLTLLLLGITLPLSAQQNTETRSRKAWEFGIGGTVYQFNRVTFSDFTKLSDGGYLFDMKLENTVWGGNLYLARELSPHFYIDLQGNVGYIAKAENASKANWLFEGGLGLQWRFGQYFRSKYIDPFIRIGAGYMYKDFMIEYTGSEGVSPADMKWALEILQNKYGADRKTLIPISAGAGINMWLSDGFGIGLQGDYLYMPYKDVANSLQGTVRLLFRWGGRSLRPAPETIVEYVDRPVDRVVEKVVEKVVERPVEVERKLVGLFENIHFDFDKATLTPESNSVLDDVATIILQDVSRRFLITGFTDARGSMRYNQGLSERRAHAVIDALVSRGVPRDILAGRGVAQRIAIAAPSASDQVRRGDRKVTIELINNPQYWDYLQNKID